MRTSPVFIAWICLLIIVICFLSIGLGVGSAAEQSSQPIKCPLISDGLYPNCRCKHGTAYDSETNTCPNPECPVNESVGIYPNCTCLQENSDFSSTFNECFQVCPKNSTGYWPDCKCPFGGTFRKDYFDCKACPKNSTGQYPDCNCVDDGAGYAKYDNFCGKCEGGSYGTFPNCKCSDGIYYISEGCTPRSCPYRSRGTYPNCICKEGYRYVRENNQCYSCPSNSRGKYPNCTCKDPLRQYEQRSNNCLKCPENSEGVYPHCQCNNGYFSRAHKICIECPANATGLYPDCTCNDESSVFSAFINQCYYSCPENSTGLHPDCDCGRHSEYHPDDFECRSNNGRTCPYDSIGIGPDCLCVRKGYRFAETYWICTTGSAGAFGQTCPDKKGKWPQCEASIDYNVLLSAVG